jgi:spermidine synthase
MYSGNFEELGFQSTAIGDISLRRRRILSLATDVYEIKLGDEYLMSSLFTSSEIAMAELSIAAHGSADLSVVVGGLGLGYSAQAVLRSPNVQSLLVVELLAPVLDWHRDGLLPLGPELSGDRRCSLIEGDFFRLAESEGGFDTDSPGRLFDIILADIDHSPDKLLDKRSAPFYRTEGLRKLMAHLKPGGIFGLWSDAEPDDAFTARLAAVFSEARAEAVSFLNPLLDREFTQTVYIAAADL